MNKSGLADSPFFSSPKEASIATNISRLPVEQVQRVNAVIDKPKQIIKDRGTRQPRHHDTMVSSNHDTTDSRIHDTTTTIETVRKAVRELGKEAATHRFTLEEKRALLDIIYSYKGAGIRTSENEVARIAINFIIEDYKTNGETSILDRVLKALNG